MAGVEIRTRARTPPMVQAGSSRPDEPGTRDQTPSPTITNPHSHQIANATSATGTQ